MWHVRRVDPDDGKVRFRISPDKLRGIDPGIAQGHFDLAGAVHDVAVRQDKTIAGEDEPGAPTRAAFPIENANVDHARCDAVNHGRDRLRVSIKQVGIA